MAFFNKVRNTIRVDPRVPKITPTVTATYSAGPNKAMGNPNAAPLGQGGSMGTSDQNWFQQFRQPTVSQAGPISNMGTWVAQLLAGLMRNKATSTPAAPSPAAATPAASPGGLKLSSWTTKAQLPAGQRNRAWF